MRKKGIKLLLAGILAMLGSFSYAQTKIYTWQDFVDEVADDEYAEQQGWTEHMEELAQLAAHPLDINTATREQLGMIPFLSEEQIEDIHTYIFLHRGMRTISELMAIESIDYRTRRYLSLFLYADQSVFARRDTLTLKKLLKHARHEVSTRMDIPLYYRDGYSFSPQSGGYEGNPLYNRLRYRMNARNRIDLGLSAEKDQGEPFRGNSGWDSYGAYLMVRDMGKLRAAIVGDYKLGFGEGLVVNNGGFATGKSSLMNQPSQGIRAKRGMDEYNYLRGAAATLRFGHTELTTWVSYRQLDATLNSNGTAKTIQTSGLHRTQTELARKHNLSAIVAGGNLTWKRKGFYAGGSGYYQHFNRSLEPGTAVYRRIYPKGSNFGVVGAHYGYKHQWFSLAGETAYSTEKGGWATMERASWKVNTHYTLSGSYRFYSYNYYSFHASALSENSEVQNESGATLRLDATPVGNLTVTAYADFFYNPWPRYSLDHSSSGQEGSIRVEYTLKRNNKLLVRYQLKRKERYNQMELHNRLRLQYTRQLGTSWQLQSIASLHAMDQSGTGFAIAQRARFQKQPVQVSTQLAYFHTPDYDTRIFQYEPLLTDMFYYPSLYGHGIRFVAAGRYSVWKQRLLIEVLYGMLRYFDRSTQSSGMQQIRSPWKNDISVQLRLRI
ncbi:MAG: hypothetical protein J5671_00835 [Bacteroidaceae bacterium]|nr:hypothetical protein [Bacteroidaceae bacterium]